MQIQRSLFVVVAMALSVTVARAGLDDEFVDVVGNTTPSITNIPGLPGYSGYEVHLVAKRPGDIIGAIDVGTNPVDWPWVNFDWGLFGPMHQSWLKDDGGVIPTPHLVGGVRDSHFLFTYDAFVMAPREDNNINYGPTGPFPLADTDLFDYGLGSSMRAIVGVAQMHLHDLPFVYLVIPDGRQVQFAGKVISVGNARSGSHDSIVSFSIGQVPEPLSTISVCIGGALALLNLRPHRTAERECEL